MSRIFVAGATGLTGRNVVEVLAKKGLDVVAHVRPDSSRRGEWEERFAAMGATLSFAAWEPGAMQEALRGVDIAIALLGTTRKRARNDQTPQGAASYETVDYGLTAMLLRAAHSAEVRRFVYLSSMGASTTTPNPYLKVRGRIESELRDSGLSWASARPSFIVGDRDETRAGEKIGSALGDGVLGLVRALGGGAIADRYQSMSGAELGRAMVTLALSEDVGIVSCDALRKLATEQA